MMGIYEIKVLPDNEKYDITFTKAQFVDKAIKGNIKYVIYAFSYFMDELKYCSLSNKIKGIFSFMSDAKLNRYSNVPKKY